MWLFPQSKKSFCQEIKMSKKEGKFPLGPLGGNKAPQKPAENIRMTTLKVTQSSETC